MNINEIISNYLISRQSIFSAIVINKIGNQYFFEHYQQIAESDIFSDFPYIDNIAKIIFANRFILDIPWDKPEYLTDDEREYGSIDPADNTMAKCIWTERGRQEIKIIANDFKNYCQEQGLNKI
ncbi:hypothetical protein [Psychrobacter sp. H7-1]|uniref:hypothetical protein n=1 Tax=Psychrobacter sp. H7-1 TaxID=1569265 RepID=UPI001917ACAE|nr:hypothetical protein [Psychrobacter sp. H7-1]